MGPRADQKFEKCDLNCTYILKNESKRSQIPVTLPNRSPLPPACNCVRKRILWLSAYLMQIVLAKDDCLWSLELYEGQVISEQLKKHVRQFANIGFLLYRFIRTLGLALKSFCPSFETKFCLLTRSMDVSAERGSWLTSESLSSAELPKNTRADKSL